jgi:hypothetical protein
MSRDRHCDDEGWLHSVLDTVYAYRVEGEPYPSRWRPFRVYCTPDREHSGEALPYWVKIRHDRDSAAVQISEVIGLGLASALGFRTHTAALVMASQAFADSVNALGSYPTVCEGPHFGTQWLADVVDGGRHNMASHMDRAVTLRLWVLDCWICVRDRTTDGNVLFLREGGKTVMLPSDHSDCFGGAGLFTANRLQHLGTETMAVAFYPEMENRMLGAGGCEIIEEAIADARAAARNLDPVLRCVPGVWWDQAQLTPDAVRDCLVQRADRLDQTCMIDHWRGLGDASADGKLL